MMDRISVSRMSLMVVRCRVTLFGMVAWLLMLGMQQTTSFGDDRDPGQADRSRISILPNILIVYADDLGYGDLSCYNAEAAYQTPRLDQLAAEGIRFTDSHSPCTICSPSRYGLFSGQCVFRTGRRVTAFEGASGPSYLTPEDWTIAEMLKSVGYRTAVFGKWHVGLTWVDREGKQLRGGFRDVDQIDYEKSTPLVDGPNAHGFDVSFITPNCPTTDPLYLYIENGMVPVPASQRHLRNTLPNPGGKWRWDNDEGWKSPGYQFVDVDELFFEKASDFLKDHVEARGDQPFFAVVSTQIAHAPVLPGPQYAGKTDAGPRGDFVRQLDSLTGQLLDLLRELGVDDNTLVVFNSDNGPETMHTIWMRADHNHDPAGGWRGMKRDGWEGGHRVPMMIKWPGKIAPGRVSNQLINTTDLFRTLAAAVGADMPAHAAKDSFNLLPELLGNADDGESIRPYMLTQSFRGEFQLRAGDWKYLDHAGSGGNRYDSPLMKPHSAGVVEDGFPGQLYNLRDDPGETRNLYESNAAKREEMKLLLKSIVGS